MTVPHSSSLPVFDGSREAWLALADRLLAATESAASPSGSLIRIGGPSSASGAWSDGLEGYARTLLLAAFRARGRGGDQRGALDRFRRGLIAGVDPSHPERWPTIAERRQAVVEAASVAIGLSETREWLWDQLDDRTRQQTVEWLGGVVGTTGYTNNWIWFQNVIEAFLASVGGPWSQADLDRNLELQEALYVGDGWYSDGASPVGRRQSFDYYAGWAWHLYPLLHARIEGRPLSDLHRERLAAFVEQARPLVGAGGAPLFQGRSLTYRFAMLAPFWVASVAGVSPLEPGETRTMARDVMRHFLDAGAVDEHGLLSVGWHGAFGSIRQLYSGGSSPYWASKAFIGLLLPADDPEWTATPEQREPSTATHALHAPGWLVTNSPSDGIVRVLNHGSDGFRGPYGAVRGDNPFYQRLAYSNITSPELRPDTIAAPLDSHVALLDAADAPSHRDVIERVAFTDSVAVSRSRVHWLDLASASSDAPAAGWGALRRGPVVTVASVVHDDAEVRLAWWSDTIPPAHPDAALDADSGWPVDPGPWRFRIGGWALPTDDAPHVDAGTVTRSDGLTSAVLPLHALDLVDVTVRAGTTPFAAQSATPWAAQSSPAAAGDVVAALVRLGSATGHDDAVPTVTVSTAEITVTWQDGTIDVVPIDAESIPAAPLHAKREPQR